MIDPLVKMLLIAIAVSVAILLYPSKIQSVEYGMCDVPRTPYFYAILEVRDKWGSEQWDYYNYIVKAESGWNNTAQNPTSTAYGLHQFLDSTWEHVDCEKTSDPYTQIDCGIKYIEDRYQTPELAYIHHIENNWY